MHNNTVEFKLTKSGSLMLDLLRGIAAQAVVIGHGLSFFGITNKFDIIQNSAVVIFFILSGIVIPCSTFGKTRVIGNYSFTSYFIDRFSRIYTGFLPALFFVLAADFLSKSSFGKAYAYSNAFNLRTFLGNLLMLQDYPAMPLLQRLDVIPASLAFVLHASVSSFGSARPFWTVAVEWWIYMFFGWVVLGVTQKARKPFIVWPVLILLLVVPLTNLVGGRGNGLMTIWLLGLLVYAMLLRFSISLPSPTLFALAGTFLLAAFTRLFQTFEAYDLPYAGLLAIGIYFSLVALQHSDVVFPRPVASLIVFNANISYALYLLHYTLLDMLSLSRGGGLLSLFIGIVLSNLAAFAMYLAFDRHHGKVRIWLKDALKVGRQVSSKEA